MGGLGKRRDKSRRPGVEAGTRGWAQGGGGRNEGQGA